MARPELTGTLVVGYGNRWFGDDGAGPAVVEALAQQGVRPGVELRVYPQLVPELAEEFTRVTRVVLIDADATLPAGVISVRRVRPRAHPGLGHRWSAAAVLSLAYSYGGAVARVRAYTIGGQNFAPGETLTEPVAAAVVRLAARLQRSSAL